MSNTSADVISLSLTGKCTYLVQYRQSQCLFFKSPQSTRKLIRQFMHSVVGLLCYYFMPNMGAEYCDDRLGAEKVLTLCGTNSVRSVSVTADLNFT